MFRNATLFRFPLSFSHQFEAGERSEGGSFELTAPVAVQGLHECALKPVGALELSSRGFVSPYGADGEPLAVIIGDHVWVTVASEDKILPAAVVNKALAEKLAEIEKREGRKPGGVTRKRIKEDLVHEMLPKALVRPSRIDAVFDLKRGFIAVDTPSRRKAEGVISELRHAFGSFPALPLNAEVAPRSVLTGWLAGEPMPEGLVIGDAAILKDATEGGGTVKLSDIDLAGEEVALHLQAGKQATRLALYWEGVGFALDESLTLRKLYFGEELMQQLEGTEREDLVAELDARFVLMAGAMGGLFDVLEEALTISKAEG